MDNKLYWVFLGFAGVSLIVGVFFTTFVIYGPSGVSVLASVISALGGLGSFATALLLAYLYKQQKETLDEQAEIAETSNKIQRISFMPDVQAIIEDYATILEKDEWFRHHGIEPHPQVSGDMTVLKLYNSGRGVAKDLKFYVDIDFSSSIDKHGHTFETTPVKISTDSNILRPMLEPEETAVYVASTRYPTSEEKDNPPDSSFLLKYLLEWLQDEEGAVNIRYRITYRDVINEEESPFSDPYKITLGTFNISAEALRKFIEEHGMNTFIAGWPGTGNIKMYSSD